MIMKRSNNTVMRMAVAMAMAAGLVSGSLRANPEGAQVVQGNAVITAPSAQLLNIQNSNGAIINWQRFDIAPGETSRFVQPSSSSSVLNRVVGNDPSRILGHLESNGRVFLINQNGLLVGEGATVDTAGFFGSTLNLTDEDFLKGRMKFEGGGAGDVVNRGYIRAQGGNIVLIAPNIENGGVIEVVDGEVLLAAGQSIELAGIDNPAIRFEVRAPANRIVNLGRIVAERGAARLFAGTLRHSGDIRATGLLRNADGSISLVAQDSARIEGSLDVSGTDGGGSVEVRAQDIELTETGRIDASATGNGDGGEVILFAEDRVAVQGEILARGGEQGGDGGFMETSGLQRLDITRAPDASAPKGQAGNWLIDPNNLTVQSAQTGGSNTNIAIDNATNTVSTTDDNAVITTESIQTALDAGTSVVLQTTTSGANSQAGDITVLSDITTTSSADVSLTLRAHNDIIFDTQSSNAITISATGAGALDLVLEADSDLDRQGRIQFLTGYGNSFPITFSGNGGQFLTNRAVEILGENGLVLDNDWTLHDSLSIESSASLTMTAATGGNRMLVVGNGGLLSGSTVTADVTVDGGAIVGGDGKSSFGFLNINGQLHFIDGLLYAVVGGASVLWESTSISASSLIIDGGQLMMAWESAANAQDILDGIMDSSVDLNLLTCTGTGCMTVNDPTAFSSASAIHPLAVNDATVTFDTTVDGYLRYGSIATVAGAQFNEYLGLGGSWGGSNPLNDWSLGHLPTATEYVILPVLDTPSPPIALDTAETVAGVQAMTGILFQPGGQLTVSEGLVKTPGQGILLDGDGVIGGAGRLVVAPDSTLGLQQGSLDLPVISWGRVATPINPTGNALIQLNADLDSHGQLMLAPGRQAIFNGNGVINLYGDIDFFGGGELGLDGVARLVVQSPASGLLGTGILSIDGNSTFDLLQAPSGVDPSIVINVRGGSILNAQNLVMPDRINWDAGTIDGDLTIGAGQFLYLNGSGNMVFNGSLLNNNGTMMYLSTGGDLVLNGTLNQNGQLTLNPTAASGINGAGSIVQTAAGSTNLIANQDLRLGVSMANAGDLFVLGGRLFIDGQTLTQASGSINVEGALGELRVTNGGLLSLSSGVGINTQADTTGGPVGSIGADLASTIDFNNAGIDLSLLGSFSLDSGSRLDGAGGTTLAANNRIQRSATQGDSVISGAGTLTLPAGSRLDSFGGRLQGIDAVNLLLIDNAGIIDTGNLDTLSLEFARLQMSGDGLVQGNGFVDLLDSASLTAGLTTGGAQNFTPRSLYLRNASSELIANGLVFDGNLGWYAGQVRGTGLTTTGNGAFVDSNDATPAILATAWTIATGSTAEWRGDGDLLLDGGNIINQGELAVLIAASGDGQKTLNRVGSTEFLRNEGLLLVNDIPGGVIEIASDFDNAGGGIAILAGTLKIDSNGDGLGDELLLDQVGEFLQGFGTFDGTVRNQAGFVTPGRNDVQANIHQAGQLTITGDFIQTTGGLLRMDLDSTASGLLADQLVVGGDLVAGGDLDFAIINNKSVLEIAALIDQSFRPFDISGSLVGSFDTVTIPEGLDFKLGPGGVITIGSDSPFLNLVADRLQALIDNTDMTYAELRDALILPPRRLRLLRSRVNRDEDERERRGGPRLVCR